MTLSLINPDCCYMIVCLLVACPIHHVSNLIFKLSLIKSSCLIHLLYFASFRFASFYPLCFLRFILLIVSSDQRLYKIYILKHHSRIWLILFCDSLTWFRLITIYEDYWYVYFGDLTGVRFRVIKTVYIVKSHGVFNVYDLWS